MSVVEDFLRKTGSKLFADKLNGSKRTTNSLRFPEDVDTAGNTNVIRFKIALPSGSKYLSGSGSRGMYAATGEATTYRKPDARGSIARRMSNNYVMTTTVIDLYMPPSLQTQYQTNWKNTDLGMSGKVIDASSALWNSGGLDTSWDMILNYFKENIGTNVKRTAAGFVQGIGISNVKDAVEIYTSTSENPYTEVMFDGVANRNFSFTFKFIPKNAREQQIIKNIVDEFKFHRAPEFKSDNNNTYMLFPSEFDIELIHGGQVNPHLFKFSTCALTNVGVNYSPDSQYASHEDGSPFAIELTLEFLELELMTKERHRQGF